MLSRASSASVGMLSRKRWLRSGSDDARGRLKGVADAVDGGKSVVSWDAQIGPFQSDLQVGGRVERRRWRRRGQREG